MVEPRVEPAPVQQISRGGSTGLARRLGLAAAAVLVPTAALTTLAEGLPAGLLAPLLGPWAGLAVGHRDCTMATGWPEATYALVAIGIVGALVVLLVRRPSVRWLAPVALALWLLGWCGTAILSLINASS